MTGGHCRSSVVLSTVGCRSRTCTVFSQLLNAVVKCVFLCNVVSLSYEYYRRSTSLLINIYRARGIGIRLPSNTVSEILSGLAASSNT